MPTATVSSPLTTTGGGAHADPGRTPTVTEPDACIARAAEAAPSPATEPTERSNSPVTSRTVMPTATMLAKAAVRTIVARLGPDRNPGVEGAEQDEQHDQEQGDEQGLGGAEGGSEASVSLVPSPDACRTRSYL